MRHIDQKERSHRLGDLGKAFKVNVQAVSRSPGDDQFGAGLMGLALHGVVVDGFLRVEPVTDHLEPLAAQVQRHAMGQVTTFGQAHAHDGVAWFQEGQKNRLVGRGAAVRLDVGRIGAEELACPIDGQSLGDIDVFAAAVVALAGVAFSVFVGQLRTLGCHHRGRGIVFARNQLYVVLLARVFGLNCSKQFGVGLFYECVAVVHGG